ncbi:MAG TPA: hypothetical protein VD970_15125 [Acetobacteraceae bacterium]|nr:hypothetical protein [Acetobacteraceae bacterium]
MRRPLLAAGLSLLALGGCVAAPPPSGAPGPVSWSASLPPDSVQGAGDPARAALVRSAFAFNAPATYSGHPWDAARAIADVEFLAVELAGPRWVGLPLAAAQLRAARPEWRRALGIAPDAPPQAVIDTLYGARRALLAGQPGAAAASLPAGLYTPGGAATLNRLASLPPLPLTAAAASNAEREATRAMFDSGRRGRSFR